MTSAAPTSIRISPIGVELSVAGSAPVEGTGMPGTVKAAETVIGNTSFEPTPAVSVIVVPAGPSTVTGIDSGGRAVPGASALETAYVHVTFCPVSEQTQPVPPAPDERGVTLRGKVSVTTID